MLHQIELWRLIPKMREEIHGFITDCQCHLADWENDRKKYQQEKREGTTFHVTARFNSIKYRERLKASQKALEAITMLERSLHE